MHAVAPVLRAFLRALSRHPVVPVVDINSRILFLLVIARRACSSRAALPLSTSMLSLGAKHWTQPDPVNVILHAAGKSACCVHDGARQVQGGSCLQLDHSAPSVVEAGKTAVDGVDFALSKSRLHAGNRTFGKVPKETLAPVDSHARARKNPPTTIAPSPVLKPFSSLAACTITGVVLGLNA
jgi:hypothetical protein